MFIFILICYFVCQAVYNTRAIMKKRSVYIHHLRFNKYVVK